MSSNPVISVIIPTYNRPENTIRAVNSALTQSLSELEVIVVDDGSTDATWRRVNEISSDHLRTFQHETNTGANAARNTGIRNAQGRYLAFLDSDDVWKPRKTELQVEHLEQTDDSAVYCDVVHSPDSIFGTLTYRIGRLIPGLIETKRGGGEELLTSILSARFPLGGSSTLVVDTDFTREIGGFDEDFNRHQDWEFLARVVQHGTLGYVDQPLVKKYDSGNPGHDIYVREKKKLLRKYSDDVIDNDLNGAGIVEANHFELAVFSIRENEYSTALRHLQHSGVQNPQRYLFLCKAFIESVL